MLEFIKTPFLVLLISYYTLRLVPTADKTRISNKWHSALYDG